MRSLVLLVVVAGMLCASLASAAPKMLTLDQLDKVTAGAGVVDWFLGGGPSVLLPGPVTPPTGTSTVEGGANNIAVDGGEGSSHQVAGALADNNAIATSGAENIIIDQQGTIAAGIAAAGQGNVVSALDQSGSDAALNIGDNASFNLTANLLLADVDEGSVAIAGTNNLVNLTTDLTDIDAEIEKGGFGVIAKEATVIDSFNTNIVETSIKVFISDSFNVTTNTLDISGQNHMNAIINANTLGEQLIGANLNVTSAATSLTAPSVSVPVGPANATANTTLLQIVMNDSLLILADINNLGPLLPTLP